MQHIEARRHFALNMKLKVCALLRWSEKQYALYQYETMLEYLEWYLPHDSQGARTLEGSEIFRKWWCNHWSNRDAQFVASLEGYSNDAELLEELYKNQHDPRTLAAAIYPNGMLLMESVSSVINKLFNPKKVIV